MSKDPSSKAKRQQRQAAALRANLQRRKARVREMARAKAGAEAPVKPTAPAGKSPRADEG
jgi:hypothetical protein